MAVFRHLEFDNHEQVAFFREPAANLTAIVAIHNTMRGPALGGCRMYPYPSEDEALHDVLRLSRGMTLKSAISRLPMGGGKAVIIGDPARDKTLELLRAFGRCLERLNGRYIVAEDSGTAMQDIRIMAGETAHVSGIVERPMPEGGIADGDPSPATAWGVYAGMRAAVCMELGCDDFKGLRIGVQGVGAVGSRLAAHLKEAGARVYISDVMPRRVEEVARRHEVTPVAPAEIYELPLDIFSPCGFGAVLNEATVPRLKARIIAGAANNQLAAAVDAARLQARGILYVPDFAINAGGVIDIAGQRAGLDYTESMRQVEGIYDTVTKIIEESRRLGLDTNQVALRMAEANLQVLDGQNKEKE
jgi:leucine dehydrogenase